MNKDYIYSSDEEIPVLVIFAPTATGKTATVGHLFSDNVPSFFSGKAEIINADSMQVYKGLDIENDEYSVYEYLDRKNEPVKNLIGIYEGIRKMLKNMQMSVESILFVEILESE